jgi:hypothetical protein
MRVSSRSTGDAHDHRVGGHRAHDHGIGPDAAVVPDGDRAEHLGAGADHHAVADRGVTLAPLEARATEGHALIEGHVATDVRRLADDHAGGMVDEQPASELGAGMDVHPGQNPGHRRPDPGQEPEAVVPQPVVDAVGPHRVHPRVAEGDLERGPGGRVALTCRLQVASQGGQHGQSLRPANSAVER